MSGGGGGAASGSSWSVALAAFKLHTRYVPTGRPTLQAPHPTAAPIAASGWRHAAACRSRRPARTPLPLRAAGKKHEHDLHNLSNVDASEMQSDPGDLGR